MNSRSHLAESLRCTCAAFCMVVGSSQPRPILMDQVEGFQRDVFWASRATAGRGPALNRLELCPQLQDLGFRGGLRTLGSLVLFRRALLAKSTVAEERQVGRHRGPRAGFTWE